MRLGLAVPPPEGRSFDFVAIGEAGVDVISEVDSLPAFDTKTSATGRRVLPGGQAATAAVGVARLGWRSRWIGAIGDDDWGRTLRRALEHEGVNVAAAIRAGAATRSAVVFVESGSGRRAIVESRDAALDIRLDEISPAELCSGRVMLVDGTDIRLSLRAAAAARRRGTRTIVDLDRIHPATMELLSQIDVVILPEGLVRELTRKTTIGEALTSLAAALPSAALLAVTLGEAGVLGVCGGKEIHVPAFAVNALDTTGAGDAFRAGFAARWLEAGEMGAEVSDLLEYAALVAALSCQALGAQTGLPTPADVAFARSKRV